MKPGDETPPRCPVRAPRSAAARPPIINKTSSIATASSSSARTWPRLRSSSAPSTSKGVLFSTTFQPGGKDARWIGGSLTHLALTLGSALMIAIAAAIGERRAAAALWPALSILSLSNGALLALGGWALLSAVRAPAPGKRIITAGLIGLLASIPLPAGLLALTGLSIASISVSLVLLLAGHFLVRRAIVFLPHEINPEPSHSQLPGRSSALVRPERSDSHLDQPGG